MTTLFCHIGWMKNYQGETEDDQLLGGGRYVQEQKTGHEICNFMVVDNRLYGYVQVGKAKKGKYQEREINFRRLGALKEQDMIAGVTIVWTATAPDGRGRKIVGWYREATVHRRYQNFDNQSPKHEDNNISGYWISAPAHCCVLLPVDERNNIVPSMTSGFPGISPIWYADSPKGADFVSKTLAFIASYHGPNNLFIKAALQDKYVEEITKTLRENGYFEPNNLSDDRIRLLREIVQRRGQDKFRRDLLSAYGGRCAITGCNVEDALEAAHIIGYMGSSTQHVKNGILMRADIHTLFDLRLLKICPETFSVVLAPSLRESSYADLHGQPLRRPVVASMGPDIEALYSRWDTSVGESWEPLRIS